MSEMLGTDACDVEMNGENVENEEFSTSPSPLPDTTDTTNRSRSVHIPPNLNLPNDSTRTNPTTAISTALSSLQLPVTVRSTSSSPVSKPADLVRPLSNACASVQPKLQQTQRHHCHYNSQTSRGQQYGNSPDAGMAVTKPTSSSSASLFCSSLPPSYDEQRLTSITGPASQYVKLNVGGSLHYTTIATLTKQPDSMLRAMFSGRLEVLTDSEGWILIDRCGKHFPLILNYLRDSNIALPESRREVMEILAEAKYYCLQGLVDLCNAWLEMSQKAEEEPAVCRVPIITTSKEEKALLQSTGRPVVKLLLNRHNNKYSYTSQSDDNLLKNLELFDKLVLRFHERVMFIKDVGAANEVCSWSFYGRGKKLGEVCCTSIVYATDKKHTKVEFPEARIYEEAMNILLYEPPIVCSFCHNVTCQSSTCNDTDSPECPSTSPCCTGDCERMQLEKLQKARSAARAAATSGNRSDCGGGNSV